MSLVLVVALMPSVLPLCPCYAVVHPVEKSQPLPPPSPSLRIVLVLCQFRDLSPSNLLLAESPQGDAPPELKVADFGLSACCGGLSASGNENMDTRTNGSNGEGLGYKQARCCYCCYRCCFGQGIRGLLCRGDACHCCGA